MIIYLNKKIYLISPQLSLLLLIRLITINLFEIKLSPQAINTYNFYYLNLFAF